MSLGENFRQASARVVSKFANKGFIIEPPSDQNYDPLTGNVGHTQIKHPLEYVTVEDSTNKDTRLKATSFRESLVWFTLANTLVIDETWGIEGYRGEIYDIVALDKVEVNNVIVGYFVLMKSRL